MSQSLSNALLHLIFSTKHRPPLIDEDIEPELYAYMVSVCTSCGSYVHKIGGIADHLHVLCTLPRTVSISDLLEQIKRTSSKWIKTKGPKYRDFSWQAGFGAFSVSESLLDVVAAYIANQKEHHKKLTFKDEYREFLRLNKVPYDERFLWE